MKTLLVIVGPTGVGKTELALRVAERYGCPIVNADSRQIYREIPIGTAAPTQEEQKRVQHYFVGTHSILDDYNAGAYEREAVQLLTDLAAQAKDHKPFAILTGGSMLYIDAVCKGLDNMPPTSEAIRAQAKALYAEQGLEGLQKHVAELDPQYYAIVDRQNPQRLLHCLEVCWASGQTYTSFRQGKQQTRPWTTVTIGLKRDRQELYNRINQRVTKMMEQGLLAEAQHVYPERQRNSLQTVGYNELFRYLDGEWSLDYAVDMIRQNSRHYAKRQLTWWNRDNSIHWLDAQKDTQELINEIDTWI